MKRLLAFGLVVIATLGALTLVSPVPAALAGTCVRCPNRDVYCGHCEEFVPQTCQHCAYCRKVPGCK
jgi:hypothetical protein